MIRKMRTAIKTIYAFTWLFIIPIIIGSSVAEALISMYETYEQHFVAGLAVLILSSLVVTWVPMYHWLQEPELRINLFPCLIVGIAIPVIPGLVFGFETLSYNLSAAIVVTALITYSELSKIRKLEQNHP